MASPPLVILGCGFTGAAAARLALAAGRAVVATTRDAGRAEALRALGVDARAVDVLTPEAVRSAVPEGAHVLVAFPPDGVTDGLAAAALPRGCRAAYVSTTGVYGDRRGVVDERTPVDASGPKAALRLAAEGAWRAAGAVALRAAGIYGPGRGLHRRVLAGTYRLPGDGSRVVSRVHVDDLAALCLAAMERAEPGAAFPVADDAPVPQAVVVRWLAGRLGVPMPPSVPVEEAPETLRHDRAVDNRAVKAAAGLALRYPTWREGFEQCLAAEAEGGG